jgi:toxin FitB
VYLVDTNVLSAGAPTKAVAKADLIDWMDRASGRLYLSVITVAEVQDGIAKSQRMGAARKALHLSEWLETVLHLYGSRIMPIDREVARRMGSLADRARGQGNTPGLADLAIAATASWHGYTILTRNIRHFAGLGVVAVDPYEALPEGV